MSNGWKVAGIGAIGGAILSLGLVAAWTWAGLMPANPNDKASDAAIHRYLTAHPEELIAMSNAVQAQQDEADNHAHEVALKKMGLTALFDPKVAFVTGPVDAKTTFVEFFDYNCPYCRASTPVMRQFYETHKNSVRFALVEFPIKGPNSIIAARAAIAARKQPDKYLAFHFMLMSEKAIADQNLIFADAKKAGLDVDKLKADMKDPSIDQTINTGLKLAENLGIDATPTFIINGKVRASMLDDKMLADMLKN